MQSVPSSGPHHQLGQSVTNCKSFVPGKWKLEQCQTCKYPRSAHVYLPAVSLPEIVTSPASPHTAASAGRSGEAGAATPPVPPPRRASNAPPVAVPPVKPVAPLFVKPSAPAPARPKVRPLPTVPRALPKPPGSAAAAPSHAPGTPSSVATVPVTSPIPINKKPPPRPARSNLNANAAAANLSTSPSSGGSGISRERSSSSATSSAAPSPLISPRGSRGENNQNQSNQSATNVAPAAALSPEEEKQKRRTYIAKEIVQTEENYVKNLRDLINDFKKPLESRKVFSPEDSKIIFMNAEAILGLQEALLERLKKRIQVWDDKTLIADEILTIVPFLKLYTEYVNGFDASNARLDSMVKNSDMYRELHGVDVVKELEKSGKEGFHGSVGLSSLSLTPILRIPRYVLLLKDLKKYTDESHPDYQNICNAFDKMSEMANYINEFKRKSEGNQRMLEVNEKLRGDLEPLREYAVDPETDPKPHQFEKTRFVLPTWCDFCGKFIVGIAPSGQKCTVCAYACHDECLENVPPDCGNPRSEPSILQSFRMYVREAAARHKQYQPGVYTQGIDTKERNALVLLFNDSMLICYPQDAHYEFGAFVPFVNRKRSRVLEVHVANVESATLSLICPRTTTTHILDFGKPKVRDSWAQGIKEGVEKWQKTMSDAASKQSLADSAKHLRKDVRRKGESLPHASQIFTPSEIESIMKNQGHEIKFSFTSTVPVWDAKEKKEFVAYVIEAMLPNSSGQLTSVTFMKRYSQFDELHENLEKRFKKVKLPKLPSKKWFGNTDVDFIQKRMRQLEEYMNALAKLPEVFHSDILEKWFKQSLDSPTSDTAADTESTATSSAVDISSPTTGSSPSSSTTLTAAQKRERRRSYVDPSDIEAVESQLLAKLHQQNQSQSVSTSNTNAIANAPVVTATVLWDFLSESETELSLHAGDQITLLDNEAGAAWWYGSLNGREGYFPANYVQIS